MKRSLTLLISSALSVIALAQPLASSKKITLNDLVPLSMNEKTIVSQERAKLPSNPAQANQNAADRILALRNPTASSSGGGGDPAEIERLKQEVTKSQTELKQEALLRAQREIELERASKEREQLEAEARRLETERQRLRADLEKSRKETVFLGNDYLEKLVEDSQQVLQKVEKLASQNTGEEGVEAHMLIIFKEAAILGQKYSPPIAEFAEVVNKVKVNIIQEPEAKIRIQNDLSHLYYEFRIEYLNLVEKFKTNGIELPADYEKLPGDRHEEFLGRAKEAVAEVARQIQREVQAQKEAEANLRNSMEGKARAIFDLYEKEVGAEPYLKHPEIVKQYGPILDRVNEIGQKDYLAVDDTKAGSPHKILIGEVQADEQTLKKSEEELKKIFEHWKQAKHPDDVSEEQIEFAELLYKRLCGGDNQLAFNAVDLIKGDSKPTFLAYLSHYMTKLSLISSAFASGNPPPPPPPGPPPPPPPPPVNVGGGTPPSIGSGARGGRGGAASSKPTAKSLIAMGDIYPEEYRNCVKKLKAELPDLLELYHPLILGDISVDQYKEYVEKATKKPMTPQEEERVRGLEGDMTSMMQGRLEPQKVYGYFLLAAAWRSEADKANYPFEWTNAQAVSRALKSYINHVGMRFEDKLQKSIRASDQPASQSGATDQVLAKDYGAAIFFPVSRELRRTWLEDPLLKRITSTERNLEVFKATGGDKGTAKQYTYDINVSITKFLELFDVQQAGIFLKRLPLPEDFPKSVDPNLRETASKKALTTEQVRQLIDTIKNGILQKIREATYEPFDGVVERKQTNDKTDIDALAHLMLETIAEQYIDQLKAVKDRFINGDFHSNLELKSVVNSFTTEPANALLRERQKVEGAGIVPNIKCFEGFKCDPKNAEALEKAKSGLTVASENLVNLKQEMGELGVSKKFFLFTYPKDELAVEHYYLIDINDSQKLAEAIQSRFVSASKLLETKLASSLSKFVKTYPAALAAKDQKLPVRIESFFSIAEGVHFVDFSGVTQEFIILNFALQKFANIEWRTEDYLKVAHNLDGNSSLQNLKDAHKVAKPEDKAYLDALVKKREKDTIIYEDVGAHKQEFRLDVKPYQEEKLEALRQYLIRIKPIPGAVHETYDALMKKLKEHNIDVTAVEAAEKSIEEHIRQLEGEIRAQQEQLVALDREKGEVTAALEALIESSYKPYRTLRPSKPVGAYIESLRAPYLKDISAWELTPNELREIDEKLSEKERELLEAIKIQTSRRVGQVNLTPEMRNAQEKFDGLAGPIYLKKGTDFTEYMNKLNLHERKKQTIQKQIKLFESSLEKARALQHQ